MSNKGISNQKSFVSVCASIVALTAFCWTVTRSRAAEHTGRRESAYGDRQGVLHARIIATGIPGAGAVAEVGDFLRGSPMHDNSLFVPYTQAGMVLEPKRVLVA